MPMNTVSDNRRIAKVSMSVDLVAFSAASVSVTLGSLFLSSHVPNTILFENGLQHRIWATKQGRDPHDYKDDNLQQ
jgi:hypothetical protein